MVYSSSTVTNCRKYRTVWYCQTVYCEFFGKSKFMLDASDLHCCPACKELGHCEQERGCVTGEGETFREVRVNYFFDLVSNSYRKLAIVKDDSLRDKGKVYTFWTALVASDKRALQVAESLLANLSYDEKELEEGQVPNTTEFIMYLDGSRKDFQMQLNVLSDRLRASNLGSP